MRPPAISGSPAFANRRPTTPHVNAMPLKKVCNAACSVEGKQKEAHLVPRTQGNASSRSTAAHINPIEGLQPKQRVQQERTSYSTYRYSLVCLTILGV